MDDMDAPPPMGGLGNYKGVMLCNRPPESSAAGMDANVQPFKSTISATYRDQLGLPPCKQAEGPVVEIKTRGPSAALRRHVRWIKELQEQVKEDRSQVVEDEKQRLERKERMQEVFKAQRDAIRQMRKDKDTLDRDELEAVMAEYPPTGIKTKKKTQKPEWAMTAAEKEAFDEDEAAKLINFAQELDFDKFIGDHEFRKHLQVMQDRASKLQKEQDAFKDSILAEFNAEVDGAEAGDDMLTRLEDGLEGASVFGESECGSAAARRRRPREGAVGGAGERPEWDSSTACGDERQQLDSRAASQAAAERILEANPDLRSVHSKGSVQRLIDKARADIGTPASQQV
eukprot:TRINITY_DN37493_c0_g1_i1.p1 TRINITY_DN37493_c0_g1~~TRINITY_DN37493_c0_g1_i1.p1  ORF type:complete len:343 (+),score=93.01 TRINITY_DN37493_c0_g1_i1:130-1158(+)